MTPKNKQRITVTAAASLLGRSRPALSRTLSRHGVEAGADGKFDSAAVFAAAAAGAIQDKNALASQSGGDDLHRERLREQIRLLTVQADRATHELNLAVGKAVPIEEHKSRMKWAVGFCRRTIDNWIKHTAAAAGSVELKQSLERARRVAFGEMERQLQDEVENQITP